MELSMAEKEFRNMHLACDLGYNHNVKDSGIVWDMIDFGYSHQHKVMEGRCSLQATIEFSMENWENLLDFDYEELKKVYMERGIPMPVRKKVKIK